MNTWPGGLRHAISQSEHELWNRSNYPGTRQLCCLCDEPTGMTESTGYFDDNGIAYCQECFYLKFPEKEEA